MDTKNKEGNLGQLRLLPKYMVLNILFSEKHNITLSKFKSHIFPHDPDVEGFICELTGNKNKEQLYEDEYHELFIVYDALLDELKKKDTTKENVATRLVDVLTHYQSIGAIR